MAFFRVRPVKVSKRETSKGLPLMLHKVPFDLTVFELRPLNGYLSGTLSNLDGPPRVGQ